MNYLKLLNNMTKNNQIYLVGGTIRDYLLEKPINDIDMIVFNSIKDVVYKFAKKINKKVIVLDKNRNIFRVVVNENIFLDFSSPVGQDLLEDLGYRDFTINSMAIELSKIGFNNNQLNIKKEHIIDPFNGIKDIEKHIIKVVKQSSIKKDPLRIIRAFRFANNLNFEINSKTKKIITDDISLIKKIKVERIREELIKFFDNKLKINIIRDFLNTNIIPVLFNLEYNNINTRNIINTLACLKKNNHYIKINNHNYIPVLITIFLELIKSNKLNYKVVEDILYSYTFNKNDVILIRDYLYVLNNLLDNHNKYKKDDDLIYNKLYFDHIDYYEISYIINCYHYKTDDLIVINDIIELLNKMKKRIENKKINGNTIMEILNIEPGERVGNILKIVKKKRALGILNSKEEIKDYIVSLSKNKNNQ